VPGDFADHDILFGLGWLIEPIIRGLPQGKPEKYLGNRRLARKK
jgi:hypothetical protein